MSVPTVVAMVAVSFLLFGRVAVASDSPQLTPVQVITLADAEARKQGYDLKHYVRGKPSYAAEIGDWILIYDEKPDKNGMTTVGAHFFIHVSDKTKKASSTPGR